MLATLSNEEKQELLLKLMSQPLSNNSQNLPFSGPSSPNSRIPPPSLPISSQSQTNSSPSDYSDVVKVEAVDKAVEMNNNRAASRFMREKYKAEDKYQSLSEKSVREWTSDKRYNKHLPRDQANKSRKQTRRLSSPFLMQEIELVNIIKTKRSVGEQVTRDFILSEAKRLIHSPHFKGSPGWLSNFKRRWNIRRRMPTSIVQKLSNQYASQVKIYLEDIRRLRFDQEQKKGIQLLIGNMDETCLRFDMTGGTTYDFKGAKEVRVRTTTGNKLTFTALLGVLSDGSKLPPVFIFKSRTPVSSTIREKYQDKALIYSNSNGWCVRDIFYDWLDLIWFNLNTQENQKTLLVMDNFSVHKLPFVETMMKDEGCFHAYIPPGCTGILQPLDMHINKPFKDAMRECFDEWFRTKGNTPENTTTAGNLRAPSADLVIEWALKSWDGISEDLIEKSFKHCGLTLNLDCSDFSRLNSKLKKIENVTSHLFNVYKEASEDPHDDRLEVSEEVEKKEGDVFSYDLAEGEEEAPNEDQMEDEMTDAMDVQHLDEEAAEVAGDFENEGYQIFD